MSNSDAIKMLNEFIDSIEDEDMKIAVRNVVRFGGIKMNSLYIQPPNKLQLIDDMKKLSNQQIADKYFVSLQTLYHWKLKYDLIPVPFRKRVTDFKFKLVYQSNVSVPEMASKWGVSPHTVRQRAKDMGLKRPIKDPTKFSTISEEEFKIKYTNLDNKIIDLALLWDTSPSNIRRKASDMKVTRR